MDENIRQTQQEKLQFESLRREQDLVLHERQMKMATIIQAWYRGKRYIIIFRHIKMILRDSSPLVSIDNIIRKLSNEQCPY